MELDITTGGDTGDRDSNFNVSYFVAKVDNFTSLKICVQSCSWACKDRAQAPQPKQALTSAFAKGKVIIIFSVNNNHGWHGFAEMTSMPSDLNERKRRQESESAISSKSASVGAKSASAARSDTNPSTGESTIPVFSDSCWHRFGVKWQVHFLDIGEQLCLPSKVTDDLKCTENDKEILVNKCRNWQQLDRATGRRLCDMIEEQYKELEKQREEKTQKLQEAIPEPFYEETSLETVSETWQRIVRKVEIELGKVILACPFGSQRYNLQTPDSDTDMFIVYQAKTSDVLGFNPPKQTIKNHETEKCDYTIHEVYRYCELLLSGDARCVETLFLHDNTIVQASPEWHQLKHARKLLLNRDCLDKYLRDAQGSKGTKYLQKWQLDNPQATHLTPKMCKLLYVIVRLLQNASNIVDQEDLCVYREDGSEARNELMYFRRTGNLAVDEAWSRIQRYRCHIQENNEQVPHKSEEIQARVEQWLLKLRYDNFSDLSTGT